MKSLALLLALLCLAAGDKPATQPTKALAPSAGDTAPRFDARSMDGGAIHFTADFSGKIVLLDFWATWCPDCLGYIPSTVEAYGKYHNLGFEVVGISLDEPNSAEKIAQFIRDNHMPWPQTYEGKHEDNSIARLYGVEGIPHPFLVDGDTGKIIATGDGAEGDALGPAVAKALEKKRK